MDKNRRRILPTIPRPSTAETRPSAAGTSVAPAYPPMHSRDPEPPPVRPPRFGVPAWGHGGDVWSRANLLRRPLHRASCWPLEPRDGTGRCGFRVTGVPMWGNPGGECPAALAGRLFMVGGSWAAGASPLHPP